MEEQQPVQVHDRLPPRPHTMASSPPAQPSQDNCETDPARVRKMPSTDLVRNYVSPFLKEHIPDTYAPMGSKPTDPPTDSANSNSKRCYRHQHGNICRKQADEKKMSVIQRELNSLSAADQAAVTHVWSLFSASPGKHRELMLQGILTQCCFPQLSLVSRELQEQLKIDFITALPPEISYKVLCYLDTVSLCKAAQVSRRWRNLADDDLVWHRMCLQHVSRRCHRCGWGLPRLEKKKLAAWSRHHNTHHRHKPAIVEEIIDDTPQKPYEPPSPGSNKRPAESDDESSAKRPRLDEVMKTKSQLEVERKFRPWKDVYRDRFKVGYNWKTGRCSIKSFKGHENGITCLQFSDNIMATGSYDATIKIWNIETGEVIQTLVGHQGAVRTLQFDESKLISGSLDKTVKIWNWQTGEVLTSLQCHTDGVLSVHFEGNLLASGSVDKTVKIFDFDTKSTFCLRGHTDWVNHVRIDPESRVIFSASDDLTVKMWDMDTKKCLKTFSGHVGQVQQVLIMPSDFEPDEVPSQDNDNASVHSRRSATPASDHGNDDRTAYGPNFVNDEARPLPPRYMMTGGLDNTLRVWDTATGKCLRSMFGHVEGVWALSGDNLRCVSGANDSMVKIWDPRSGVCERSFAHAAGPITCVGLSDSRMASGSEDGEVRLYSFQGEVLEERGTPS